MRTLPPQQSLQTPHQGKVLLNVRRCLGWMLLLGFGLGISACQPSAPSDPWSQRLIEALPELTTPQGDRLPLVLWRSPHADGNSVFSPLPDASLTALAARGIGLPLSPLDDPIDRAKRRQRLGLPLIWLDARSGDHWPWSLADGGSMPLRFQGWSALARQWGEASKRWQGAGLTPQMALFDYELKPLLASDAELAASDDLSALLSHVPLDQRRDARRRFARLQARALASNYLAAPLREVYPDLLVSNWATLLSSTAIPMLGLDGQPLGPLNSGLFSATNPVAYGWDRMRRLDDTWHAELAADPAANDRYWLRVVLEQVSIDADNRQRFAPWLKAVAWVAREVRDMPDVDAPAALSRARWREALRHLWLRDVDAMAVFNPPREQSPDSSLQAVEDAQAIFAETLAWNDLIDGGRPLNFALPDARTNTLWSGMANDQRAIVRVTCLIREPCSATVDVFGRSQPVAGSALGVTVELVP
ncbi:hypothetical protein OAS86_05405 [Gammaproteobacteria bacterium]|nr:hypothetical protein [Gammaproteobacteria bacterium]